MDEDSKGFLSSATLISVCTLLSRVLGVLRDSASAAVFGAGPVWDAFSFAFQIPNLFRKLFGEGALGAAFIPIFTEYAERGDRQETARMAAAVAGCLATVLLGLLLLAEALCLLLLGTGLVSDKWRLPLMLTAVLLPYSFLICMTAFSGGILQSFKRFAAPAVAPVILNLFWIISVWLIAPAVSKRPVMQVFVLAAGILAAGVVQLALQLAMLRRRGFALRIHWQPRHPGLRRCMRNMAPIILGLAVFQINVLMDGIIAVGLARPVDGPGSFGLLGAQIPFPLEPGARSVLYFGDRLMQFPLGVFGIALATALFPTLARHATREDWDGFGRALRDALAVVWLIGLPASVGLILVRRPAVSLIFERGAFTAAMTGRTAGVVMAYSCGIWAYCALHVLVRAFYAHQDTVTPVRISAVMVGLNFTLNLALVWPLGVAGMAAATAFCAAVQVFVLVLVLQRRRKLQIDRQLVRSLLKTAIATGMMLPTCLFVLHLTAVWTRSFAGKAVGTALTVGAGLGVFLAVSLALRNRALLLLIPKLRRR